jgi:hypothetical protein
MKILITHRSFGFFDQRILKIILVFLGVLFLLHSPISAQSLEDIQAVLQTSIDFPALQTYFHEEEAGRTPLIIEKNEFVPEVQLEKFGQAVLFLSAEEIFITSQSAHIQINFLTINQATADVVFSYPIEGIRLSLSFIKEGETWEIQASQLTEQ